MKVAQTVVAMILGIVLPLLVQLWDKRRLSEVARARSWNVASWGSALYAFGPLSMLGWSWVTRRGWPRFLMGPCWMGAIVLVMTLLDHVLMLVGGGESEGSLVELVVASVVVVVAGVVFLALLVPFSLLIGGTALDRDRRP